MDTEQDYSLSSKENKSCEIQEFCQTFTKGESKSQGKQSNTASTPREDTKDNSKTQNTC